jgi:hypothetical protein
VFSKRISRGKLLDFFAAQPRCRVALEACGGAHHWYVGLTVGKRNFNTFGAASRAISRISLLIFYTTRRKQLESRQTCTRSTAHVLH